VPYMDACSAEKLGKDIERVSSLSEKAVEDPDAAQELTGLIKDLLNYKVRAQSERAYSCADVRSSDCHYTESASLQD
jgi:hypothetical protein